MNVMKRFMAAALMLCMVLCLCACGGSDTAAETTEPAAEETVAAAPTVEETEAPTEAEEVGTTYKITVVDEEGNPIAGTMVQICMDTCLPGMTNENGVAEFTVEEADYKVSFMAMPEGYTYTTEEQEFYFEDGSYEMTITLKVAE